MCVCLVGLFVCFVCFILCVQLKNKYNNHVLQFKIDYGLGFQLLLIGIPGIPT